MAEVRYIPCQHGVLWRVVNPWLPSRWRKPKAFHEGQTFRCPCGRR